MALLLKTIIFEKKNRLPQVTSTNTHSLLKNRYRNLSIDNAEYSRHIHDIRKVADSRTGSIFHTGYGMFHCDSMKHKVILH